MDEAKAREIYRASDLTPYSHEELSQSDAWVKAYAIEALRAVSIITGFFAIGWLIGLGL